MSSGLGEPAHASCIRIAMPRSPACQPAPNRQLATLPTSARGRLMRQKLWRLAPLESSRLVALSDRNAGDFGGMMPNRPLIAAIGCGGTISSLGRDSMDVLDYPDFGTKLHVDFAHESSAIT